MKTNTNRPDSPSEGVTSEHIAQLLTQAASQLDDDTVAALRRARDIALERQPQNRPVFLLSMEHGMRWLMPHATHQWLALIILLAALLLGGLNYWQHLQENDLSHVDAAILSDDLPLEVFVD